MNDKLKHFACCFVATMLDPMFAIGLAIGKEYADHLNPNNKWCWWDMTANFLGIMTGLLLRYIIMLLL